MKHVLKDIVVPVLLYLQYIMDTKMLGKNRKVRGKNTKNAKLSSSESTVFTIRGIHCTVACIFQDICSYVNLILFFISQPTRVRERKSIVTIVLIDFSLSI